MLKKVTKFPGGEGGGGGVVVDNFFLENQLYSFSFHFACIEKCPSTYWLNGRWFLQIVDRDIGDLYPIYPLFPYFFISNVGGGGNVFLAFMLFPTFIEKKFWE